MVKVSRIHIAPRSMGLFIDNLRTAITLLGSKDEVKQLFNNLLTHTEGKMLAKRLQVAKMLMEGYNYQTIQAYVKVTPGTIARVNNLLVTNGSGLKRAIEHLLKIEKQREKRLMQNPLSWGNLKKKYPTYFLPEIILEEFGKLIEKEKRKASAKEV